MDNSKDWGEFLEGIKAAQQATEAQRKLMSNMKSMKD